MNEGTTRSKRKSPHRLPVERTQTSRAARAVGCEVCGQPVWRGLCADFGGWEISADIYPLSRLGEALALLGGRKTCELRFCGDRYELSLRSHFEISGRPPGTDRIDVLVRHECEASNLPPYPQMISNLRSSIKPTFPLPDKPPF